MGHDHSHKHDHHHATKAHGRAFAVGIGLNLAFVTVEVIYGVLSHSVALLADAGHNFGDVLGLGLSWGATALANLKPSTRRTFGFLRTTIVASVANALILLFVTGGLAWESIRRLISPAPAQTKTMIVVALVGAAVNTASALLFMAGSKKDSNVRSAFLHLAADAVLAVGVAVAGGVILFTGWLWLDPAASIVLAIAILGGTGALPRASAGINRGYVSSGGPWPVADGQRPARAAPDDLSTPGTCSLSEARHSTHPSLPIAPAPPLFRGAGHRAHRRIHSTSQALARTDDLVAVHGQVPTGVHAHGEVIERLRRRPSDDLSVRVELTAVAGADEARG